MAFHFGPGPGAHVAFDQGFAIVLDLHGNRYWALDAAALARPESSPAVERLLQSGRLRRLSPPAASIGGVATSEARARYAPPRAVGSTTWTNLIRFVVACVWARGIVAGGRLRRAQEVLARKWRVSPTSDVHDEIAQFELLRPLWPDDQVCLFDSLALVRFLRSAGHEAEIVFGVRARPFSAHCWVERQGEVLSDLNGQFASYAVILRI